MTFLRSIELRGFKTFARATELLLEPGVTVIIGPNGSGKSNIADAVVWALGEQSPSALRGRSMQEVIFAGSDGKKAAAAAEVALVFDNSAGSIPLAASEVQVTRRLMRDGSSEYRLNGSPCRLIDVHEVLSTLGLGREMHSVIGQGRVEEILNSTPLTRRALVEEAAGLGRYRRRRQRAQTKLDKVEENLSRVLDVEREVLQAMRPLKAQMKAAERHAEVAEELALLQAKVALAELMRLRREREAQASTLRVVAERRHNLEEALRRLQEERLAQEASFAAALAEREAATSVFHRLSGELERLDARATALGQRMARGEAAVTRAARRREQALAEQEAVREHRDSLDRDQRGSARLARVARFQAEIGARLAERRPLLEAQLEELEERKDRLVDLEAERSRVLQEREFVRRDLEERARRRAALEESVRAAEQAAATLEAMAANLATERSQATERQQHAAAALVAADDGFRAVQLALETAQREERQAREQREKIVARMRILEEVVTRSEGIPEGARRLLADRAGARLLIDLLQVQDGYEKAVSAALGPLAEAVVMQGGADAGLVLGITGEIEVVWPAESSPTSVPSGLPGVSLWEYVTADARLVAALASLLPPLRVVSSLPEVEGSTGGARGALLVTPAGEVSLGPGHAGRRADPVLEAHLEARAELARLSAAGERAAEQCGKATSQAETALALHQAGEDEVRRLRQEVDNVERETRQLAEQADLTATRLDEARTRRSELLTRRDRSDQTATRLTGELSALEQRLAALLTDLGEGRQEMHHGDERLSSLRGEVERLEGKAAQASLLAVRLRERGRAWEEELSRATRRVAVAEREVEAASAREEATARYRQALTPLRDVLDGLRERVSGLVKEAQAAVDQSRSSTGGFTERLQAQAAQESRIQAELGGLVEASGEAQVALAHLEEQAAERDRELEQLRLRHLAPRALRDDEVVGIDVEALAGRAASLERRRDQMGPVNPLAEHEYRRLEERAEFLAEQRRDLETSLSELRTVARELDRHIDQTFTSTFAAVKHSFEETVPELFPGGKGTLKLVSPLETGPAGNGGGPAEAADEPEVPDEGRQLAGIGLEIKPAHKSTRSLALLSGGEKALAALAFLFALFLARPCPFYLLDEVEAALDEVNIGRFVALIRRYERHAQFIIITHQQRTMEVADTLFGVALDADGTSRVLSRKLTPPA